MLMFDIIHANLTAHINQESIMKSKHKSAIDISIENELNEANLSIAEKLNLETAVVAWKEIERFFARGNLLQVEPGCDLINVAQAIAENDATKIESLIGQNKIAFATIEWVKAHCQAETQLWTLVVAPYVICQLKQ
jgi:hypothetical protein